MTSIVGPFRVGDNPAVDLEISVTREGESIETDDYDSASVLVFDPSGTEIEWDATITLDDVNDVVIVPFPDASPFAVEGFYTLYPKLTNGVNVETADPVLIQILALTNSTAWATVTDVLTITRTVVTNGVLLDAQEIIEIFCGRSTSTPSTSMKARDRDTLKKAVAWQAAWLPSQPGYKTRHWIKEIVQDGTNIVYIGSSEPANPAMVSLAPLAARALKNLSWMAGNSIRFRPPEDALASGLSAEEYRRNDDHGGWRPL